MYSLAIKIALPILALLALAGWISHVKHAAYKDGLHNGRAEVQLKFDAFTEATRKAGEKQASANALAETAAAARNEQVEVSHAKELAAAVDGRDRNLRLLKQARACTRSGGAEEAGRVAAATDPGATGSPAAAPEAAGRAERIDAAIADVMVEARQNAAQLNGLIAEIVPQL